MRRSLIGVTIAVGIVASGPAWPAGASQPPTALQPNSKVLFAPDLAAHPQEESGYPRLLRLEHSGAANGTLLATFTHAGGALPRASLPIYRMAGTALPNGKCEVRYGIGSLRKAMKRSP